MEQPNNPDVVKDMNTQETIAQKDRVINIEHMMRDNIRKVVLHKMAILYDDRELSKILAFLAMFSAFTQVGEVVSVIKEYIDELENDWRN